MIVTITVPGQDPDLHYARNVELPAQGVVRLEGTRGIKSIVVPPGTVVKIDGRA